MKKINTNIEVVLLVASILLFSAFVFWSADRYIWPSIKESRVNMIKNVALSICKCAYIEKISKQKCMVREYGKAGFKYTSSVKFTDNKVEISSLRNLFYRVRYVKSANICQFVNNVS